MAEHKSKNKIEEEKKLDEKKKEQLAQQQQLQQQQQVLDEDDDDFEEFENEDWDEVNQDEKIDVKQWREDWDDEDVNDDFTQQLRAELKL